jgi:hypothetical protein
VCAAEVVLLAFMLVNMFRGCGIDVHPADRITFWSRIRRCRFHENSDSRQQFDSRLFAWIPDALYWIHPAEWPGEFNIIPRAATMTYLDVVFNYVSLPGERELQAIDNMREVYGIRRVHFNGKDKTVRIEFDASRLKQDAVAKLLRSAGIDVRDPVVLA